jgi:hypothetical protein
MNRQLKWTYDREYFVIARQGSGLTYANGTRTSGATWPARGLKARAGATCQNVETQLDQIWEWIGDLPEIEPSPDFRARFWARVRAGGR